MTRLWPEGEVIGISVEAQAHRNAFALPQGVFAWQGMVHRITHVCNRWRIDTHWWARLPEAVLDEKPSSPPSGETCTANANPSSQTDRSRSALSPTGERRKRLVDVISPIPAGQGAPGAPPSGEGTDQRSVGEGETYSAGIAPPSPTDHPQLALSSQGERSVWREYIKVTTDTGLLCLLYRNLHDGGWFLARVYD